MSGLQVRQAYFPACLNDESLDAAERRFAQAAAVSSYRPSREERIALTQPIAFFLTQCTCYDMLGMSTQVVVLDVEATLSVAFIAAQETRVQNCVLWDPKHHRYAGLLSSTDYIKILLYCQSHVQEAEGVSSWTIRRWLTLRNSVDAKTLASSGGELKARTAPDHVVSCTSDTSLKECLEKMRAAGVRRLVAMAEKEGESFSLVAMLDVEQIVEYLGMIFFHLEKASADGGEDGSSEGGGGGGRHGSGVYEDGSANSHNNNNNSRENSSRGSSPGRVGAGGDDEDRGPLAQLFNNVALPPHLSAIMAQAEHSSDGIRGEPRAGPFRSMFDVPLRNLPPVGVHQKTPIFVTMENKLSEALLVMLRNNIESIAVCTEERVIVDVISRTDILKMEDQGVYDTNLTVRDALASKMKGRIFVCYEKDSVRNIFSHFVLRQVKELYVVDEATGKLQGQLNVAEFVFLLVFDTTAETTKPK